MECRHVTKCHACHVKRHHNFLRHLEKETCLQLRHCGAQRKSTTSCDTLNMKCFSSFPPRHCEARGKSETPHDTRGSLTTSISYETSSKFDTLTPSQTEGFAASPIDEAQPETRKKRSESSKTSILCEMSFKFDELYHKSRRFPTSFHKKLKISYLKIDVS